MSRTNSQFLGASVNEFIQIWALGGNATLNLTTSGGLTKVAFNCTLGKPSDPHSHVTCHMSHVRLKSGVAKIFLLLLLGSIQMVQDLKKIRHTGDHSIS